MKRLDLFIAVLSLRAGATNSFVVVTNSPQRRCLTATAATSRSRQFSSPGVIRMVSTDTGTEEGSTSSSSSSSSSSSISASSTSVTVTRLPDSKVEIQIPVPGPATQAAYDKVCTELSKTVSIPGFRKGRKIPPQVLEQAMAAKGGRNALKVQAIHELLSQLVEPALKEQALDPIGQATLAVSPDDLALKYAPGKDLVLPVRCDVWPDVAWKGGEGHDKPYVGLGGSYQRRPPDQAKLDKALTDLRERYAVLDPMEDPSYELQMGDACTVNMAGYLALDDGTTKGEPLPNAASGDRVEVVLGPGRYMEGLVEGLVGGKVGETKTVAVSFPEKLRDKTLAGKRAIFDVEIVEAAKRIIPEVSDEFASRVRPGLTADSLMAELKKAVDEEDSKEFLPARNKALGEALAQVVEVEVPDTLVTNQAREKFAVMMADMRDNGVNDETIQQQITPENFNKYKAIVKDGIVKDFKISMATDEIARLEGINVPDYQVQEQMESIRKDAAEHKEEIDENLIRAKVETTLQRQAVYDWLAERSSLKVEYLTDKDEKFDEALMEQLAEESLRREQELVGASKTTEDPAPVAPSAVDVSAEEVHVSADAGEAAAARAPAEETEEEKQARYAKMSLEERAYQILKDIGSV